MITQDELKTMLNYDLDTGKFVWIVSKRGINKDKSAGSKNNSAGHIGIMINGKTYLAHRLAWLYVYGTWPKSEIDHINGIPGDNRIANLREATAAENQWNTLKRKTNTSGIKGVCWHKNIKRWIASFRYKNQNYYIGSFLSKEDAGKAYADFVRPYQMNYYPDNRV